MASVILMKTQKIEAAHRLLGYQSVTNLSGYLRAEYEDDWDWRREFPGDFKMVFFRIVSLLRATPPLLTFTDCPKNLFSFQSPAFHDRPSG